MAFISFQRSARSLAAVAHALAEAYGLTEELTEEGRLMASDFLADPDYLPSVAARAWRWEPEMHEVVDTLRSASLPTDLVESTASVMSCWKHDKDRGDIRLAEVLARLRGKRL